MSKRIKLTVFLTTTALEMLLEKARKEESCAEVHLTANYDEGLNYAVATLSSTEVEAPLSR